MRTQRYCGTIKREEGFAILPLLVVTVLIVGGVAAALAFLGTSELLQSQKQAESTEAVSVAAAGVSDAMIKLVRDRDAASAGYTLQVNNGTATVVIQQDSFSAPCTATGASGKACIVSTGEAGDAARRIESVVTISSTGKITVDSYKEIEP